MEKHKEVDDGDDTNNLNENVQEILPPVSQVDLTRPIDPLKKSKKELDKMSRLRVIEQNKYTKRRMQKKLAKASKKKNRKR